MPTANSIFVMGHLGRDAETKYTPSGHSITSFSIALEVGTKEKPRTAWVDVKAWNQCQAAQDILKKGQLIAVTGRIDVETWEDKETGQRRSKTLVVADMVHQPQWEKREKKTDDGVVSRPRSSQPAKAAVKQSDPWAADDSDLPF